ncbi:TPA: hypothetical protein ACNVSR_001169 [Klebsiella pneumoniae]|nr:hypothetical protein [Klebsiella pneumoniae]
MGNEIEKIAQQNEMSIEFVTWFFNEKKVGCGNVWLIMMAAMWEGWKGRSIEMDKLAAENVALKQYALDCVNAVENWNSWADKEDQIHNDIETPATDRIVAGIKADGVEQYAALFADTVNMEREHNQQFHKGTLWFAQKLREGADK